jgi:hypothetical protein
MWCSILTQGLVRLGWPHSSEAETSFSLRETRGGWRSPDVGYVYTLNHCSIARCNLH